VRKRIGKVVNGKPAAQTKQTQPNAKKKKKKKKTAYNRNPAVVTAVTENTVVTNAVET